MSRLAGKRALLVGVGGLGGPAAIVLARAGVGTIGIADDDDVELSNLHRQILFTDADVGKPKVEAAAKAIREWAGKRYEQGENERRRDLIQNPPPLLPSLFIPPGLGGDVSVVTHKTRVLPHNVREIVRAYDVVVEGSDNFATKFMTADACALERVAVVHGSAVRWHGTALAVAPGGAPCYRCLFEDIPHEQAPNCAEAGVMGPIVGIVAALQADLALRILQGEAVFGEVVTFEGKTDAFRRHTVAPRPDCPLCGMARIQTSIRTVDASRYAAPACDVL